MSYVPELPPTRLNVDPTELLNYVYEELVRIGDELAKYEMVEYNVAPEKPFNGMVVIADGTNWNPGSGRGQYWYDESATSWNFLG